MAVATSGGRRGAVSGVLRLGVCAAVVTLRNLANILTAFRLAAAVPLLVLIVTGQHQAAFWLFIVGAVTDLVDGLVAKWVSRPTRFGALLDPLADKLFLGLTFVGLALSATVPLWLTLLIVARDVAIGTGAWLLGRRVHGFRIEPLIIGKLCTLVQLVFAGLVLARQAGLAVPDDWVAATFWTVVAFTLASGLSYLGAAVRLLRTQQA